MEKLGMRRWRFEKETLTHPAKTFENKVFECTDGVFGKTLQQGGGKAGVVWKTGKAGKNLINGNDKGVLRARETKQNLNRPGIFEKRWTTRVLNFEKCPAG